MFLFILPVSGYAGFHPYGRAGQRVVTDCVSRCAVSPWPFLWMMNPASFFLLFL
jgi:hypothetical protein